jgi:hypothetical protein
LPKLRSHRLAMSMSLCVFGCAARSLLVSSPWEGLVRACPAAAVAIVATARRLACVAERRNGVADSPLR